MLPTFVIGLREGLEAALIVSIIATFLKQNGVRLRGMWIGVGAGVALSIAVGVILKLVEQSLPQAQQEGMETVIGAVAVFFVTAMILWMRTHARTMKNELQSAAADALRNGTTTALAVMAFLAVLREGFETSVFLLATFSSASSAPAAMLGAILGVAVAVVLGWGMYAGGVRLNLQRFFKITGVFLVFVAAGLVMFGFRTAHEAGWVTVGQQKTVDLTWLAPNGSIRSALFTGVFGIQRDPRLIEVLAWLAYLVPMLALMFWPDRLKPSARVAQRLRIGGAVAAVIGAVALATLVRLPQPAVPAEAPLSGGGTASVSLGAEPELTVAGTTIALKQVGSGSDRDETSWTAAAAPARPATLTIEQLMALNGGRVPGGMSASTAPGPYRAHWTDQTALTVLTRNVGLVDAHLDGRLTLTYSGGGLTTPRVLTIDGWQVDSSYAAANRAAIAAVDAVAHDRMLWKAWVPIFLGLVALGLALQALRLRSGARAGRAPSPSSALNPASRVLIPAAVQVPEPEGTAHHVDSQA